MSKIIASAAIRGAHEIVKRVEKKVNDAIKQYGADKAVAYPNTAYFLPIIYGNLGIKIEKLGDMPAIVERCKALLPDVPTENMWLPYLGPTLDAGMATLFAYDIEEALKYIDPDKCPYLPAGTEYIDPESSNIWLGAADDVIMRKRGVEFVDGSAPGFAAIVGAAPDNATAVKIAKELQEKYLYVFMAADHNGKNMAEQLKEEGVQLGWDTRLVPFGKDVSAAIHAVGFATRASMSFGGAKPGDYKKVLRYNKNRIFAFVLAFGKVTDEWYAAAAGAINYGFPTIADSDIPEILPTGICTYEHVVSNIPHDRIVAKAIEVRGLKIVIKKVDVPVSYGPAFEGERINKEQMRLELGGPKSVGFEFCESKDLSEIEDNKITIVGKDIDELPEGGLTPISIWVEVAGRKFQKEFEPIIERQFHHLLNEAEGVLHIGQRDILWMRLSKKSFDAGFRLKHLGQILHDKLHQDFGAIIDKAQVTIYTEMDKVKELLEKAKKVWHERDTRLAGMRDEDVDTYYSCTLCQSFAPSHVCVITPERPGLCGAYNMLDCKASFEINPTGPNQPIPKGEVIDIVKGRWKNTDEFIYSKSGQTIEYASAYSIMDAPMTSCGCFEAIAAFLPQCNAVMVVDRDYTGDTPCGMRFSTLAGTVGGGLQTPGFVGISKLFIASKKFISAEGSILRLAWLPKALKEFLAEQIKKRAQEVNVPDLYDKIATEENCTTEEELYEFMQKVGHPALEMEPLM